MGFTPSLLQKRMTERCSSLVHVAIGAAIFALLLRRRVAFLHRTATCRPLFKPSVSLLSTYKTIELWFEFLSHFQCFRLTLPRSMHGSSDIFRRTFGLKGTLREGKKCRISGFRSGINETCLLLGFCGVPSPLCV